MHRPDSATERKNSSEVKVNVVCFLSYLSACDRIPASLTIHLCQTVVLKVSL